MSRWKMSQTEMVVTITATAKPGELVAICLRLQPASFTVSVSLSPVPPPPSWSSLILMPLRPPPPPLLSPVPLKHFSASVAKSDDDRDNLSLVASALSTVLQWSHGSICLMMVVVVALKWISLCSLATEPPPLPPPLPSAAARFILPAN